MSPKPFRLTSKQPQNLTYHINILLGLDGHPARVWLLSSYKWLFASFYSCFITKWTNIISTEIKNVNYSILYKYYTNSGGGRYSLYSDYRGDCHIFCSSYFFARPGRCRVQGSALPFITRA